MQMTLTIDNDLLQKASDYSRIDEKSSLIKEALLALIQRESAKNLATMGGTDPQATQIARR